MDKHIIEVIEANEAMNYTDEYENGEDKDLLTETQEGPLLEALMYLLALVLVIGTGNVHQRLPDLLDNTWVPTWRKICPSCTA